MGAALAEKKQKSETQKMAAYQPHLSINPMLAEYKFDRDCDFSIQASRGSLNQFCVFYCNLYCP
jgi:hypothetical protein